MSRFFRWMERRPIMRASLISLLAVLFLFGFMGSPLFRTPAFAEEEEGMESPDGSAASAKDSKEPLVTSHIPNTKGMVGASKIASRDYKLGASDSKLISLDDLVAGSLELDDEKFQFSGEVVGDIINAGSGYSWITLSDENASISVYLKDSDTERIAHVGRYGVSGSTVVVSGDFHLACDAHDGEVDFHAASISLLRAGGEVDIPFDTHRLMIAGGVLLAGLVLVLVNWRLKERLR